MLSEYEASVLTKFRMKGSQSPHGSLGPRWNARALEPWTLACHRCGGSLQYERRNPALVTQLDASPDHASHGRFLVMADLLCDRGATNKDS